MNKNIQTRFETGYPMKDVIKFERPVNKLKVLFADDEPALQELMHLELPRMGHEVTVCPDGNTAVAALEKNTYDCIIVDLDMPGLSGIQVIGKCKELSPDTDAVVLTGKGSFDTAVQALKHGAVDYLTKPCKLVDQGPAVARRQAARMAEQGASPHASAAAGRGKDGADRQ